MNDAETLSCHNNPDDPLTPGDESGARVSGPSFGVKDLRGSRSAPLTGVDGPVSSLTTLIGEGATFANPTRAPHLGQVLMPSRIIRESCRTSPNLDQLSD